MSFVCYRPNVADCAGYNVLLPAGVAEKQSKRRYLDNSEVNFGVYGPAGGDTLQK